MWDNSQPLSMRISARFAGQSGRCWPFLSMCLHVHQLATWLQHYASNLEWQAILGDICHASQSCVENDESLLCMTQQSSEK